MIQVKNLTHFMPFRILLDPGHGGKDPGAQFKELQEKNIVLDICLAALHKLQWRYWTALTRVDDSFLSIHNRSELALKWPADVFISVHGNADPDTDLPGMPEAKGEEIWIAPEDEKSRRLAEALKAHVDQFFPSHGFRAIKETVHLGLLNRTAHAIPAVLVEIGFIDNLQTYGALQDDLIRRRIGALLVAGVRNYVRQCTKVPDPEFRPDEMGA